MYYNRLIYRERSVRHEANHKDKKGDGNNDKPAYKLGYILSKAFKTTWRRIKDGITVKAAGVTFGNIQERLQFLAQFRRENLTITLEREKDNKYDSNAIQIVVHIKPIHRRAVVAMKLAKVLDMGIQLKASLMGIIRDIPIKKVTEP